MEGNHKARFLSILEQEIETCERLVTLNKQEREVVASGRSDELTSLYAKQEALLERLRALEGEALAAGASAGAEGPADRRTGELQARLRAVATDLRDLGQRNHALLYSHFAVTDETIRFLAPLRLRGGGYAQTGGAAHVVEPRGVYRADA